MHYKAIIEKRRSIRKFTSQEVSQDLINQMLEAARLAPSGSNIQPWRFKIVQDKEVLKKIVPIAGNHTFIQDASVLFICCCDLTAFKNRKNRITELMQTGALSNEIGKRILQKAEIESKPYDPLSFRHIADLNTAIAIEHIVLMAVSLGLGSCWIRMFNEQELKKLLCLPENIAITALLPVGYPAEFPEPRKKLTLEEIII